MNVDPIQITSSSKLNALNQMIWNNGFTWAVLKRLKEIIEEVYDGTCLYERFPQAQQPGLQKGSKNLCAAAIICRGCPGTESEVRPIYRTDDLIAEGRIQEYLVEYWARISGVWYDNPESFFTSISQIRDSGTESLVYFDVSKRLVRKLISLKHYNVLRLAIDRIVIHNSVFLTSSLKVVGFGRKANGEFVIMVEQPYVEGDVVPENERVAFMTNMGFSEAGEDYGMHLNYKTDSLYIGDLNDYNVIKGADGIHVIDCDCRLNVPTLGCGGNYSFEQPQVDWSVPFFANDIKSVISSK